MKTNSSDFGSLAFFVRYFPIFGIVVFLVLYFYAASIYPGGTRFEPSIEGYSHIKNFWSDLLDFVAYIGKENPSRPIAVAGVIALSITLIAFYFFIPKYLSGTDWGNNLVRWLGIVAMFLTAFLPFAHDTVLMIVPIFVVITSLLIFLSLLKDKEKLLLFIGLLAIMFLLCNYLMWLFEFYIEWIPLIQKMAILTFFLWVSIITIRYNRSSYLEY